MKKTVLILLSVMLALCAVSCAAETVQEPVVPAFRLIPIVPEGYDVVDEEWQDPYLGMLTLKSSDLSRPALMVLVAYNDSIEYLTFNDESIGSDEVKTYIDTVAYDYEREAPIPYTVENTGLGTGVVIFDRATSTEFYSIWHGYEVSLYAFNLDAEGNESSLTPEQKSLVMKFLTDLDISKVIEEEQQ